MRDNPIITSSRTRDVITNLYGYDIVRSQLSWDRARGERDDLPAEQGLSIAHEAVTRHTTGSVSPRTAST